MDTFMATEIAYKNGYAKGYEDGKNGAECEYKVNESVEEAINHFKYGITHDIFKEPVLTYAKMAVEALKKYK